MYTFLQEDLDDLDEHIKIIEERLRDAMGGVHATTEQSSETWHDNPQFDEQQKLYGMWANELASYRRIRAEAELISPPEPNGMVQIGSAVSVKLLASNARWTLTIASYRVLSDDEDRVSYEAPLAKLIMGAKQGDVCTGDINGHEVSYEILEVA